RPLPVELLSGHGVRREGEAETDVRAGRSGDVFDLPTQLAAHHRVQDRAAAARHARDAGRHADPIVTDLEPELVIPLRELDGDGAGTLLGERVPQRVADELVEREGDGNGRAL